MLAAIHLLLNRHFPSEIYRMSQFKFKLLIPFHSEFIILSLAGTCQVASHRANHWAMMTWLYKGVSKTIIFELIKLLWFITQVFDLFKANVSSFLPGNQTFGSQVHQLRRGYHKQNISLSHPFWAQQVLVWLLFELVLQLVLQLLLLRQVELWSGLQKVVSLSPRRPVFGLRQFRWKF